MIKFIKGHKQVIIGCAVFLCACLLASALISCSKQDEKEEVPPGRIHDAGVFGDDIVVHDSTEGEIIISVAASFEDSAQVIPLSASMKIVSNPDEIWTADTYAGNHTFAEQAQMQNGSIGLLTIPKLRLSVNVYESPDNLEAMEKGVAHFPSTSAFDSNVGLSAHNQNFDGSDGYFKDLHTLEQGDIVMYKTALGERSYEVSSITTIAASDWSPLYHTDDNRLTMITCITGQQDKRLCVVAIESAS
jgi:LPXTG-site transpeptidase (sortase) family protein